MALDNSPSLSAAQASWKFGHLWNRGNTTRWTASFSSSCLFCHTSALNKSLLRQQAFVQLHSVVKGPQAVSLNWVTLKYCQLCCTLLSLVHKQLCPGSWLATLFSPYDPWSCCNDCGNYVISLIPDPWQFFAQGCILWDKHSTYSFPWWVNRFHLQHPVCILIWEITASLGIRPRVMQLRASHKYPDILLQ